MDAKPYILKNKSLSEQAQAVVQQLLDENEQVLFVIMGDLNLKGQYASTALIFSREFLITCDGTSGDERRIAYADMAEVEAKRMYGNATLSAVMPNGKREIVFRYSYAVASLCDAAALFINHLNEGADFNEENAVMHVTFERALSVCPKCGRNLLHPGAECIKCRSKMKIVKQLYQYIKPQNKILLVSILLSLVTTVMALVPPTVTGFIVDVVFGGSTQSNIPILGSIAKIVGPDAQRLLPAMILCLLSC